MLSLFLKSYEVMIKANTGWGCQHEPLLVWALRAMPGWERALFQRRLLIAASFNANDSHLEVGSLTIHLGQWSYGDRTWRDYIIYHLCRTEADRASGGVGIWTWTVRVQRFAFSHYHTAIWHSYTMFCKDWRPGLGTSYHLTVIQRWRIWSRAKFLKL